MGRCSSADALEGPALAVDGNADTGRGADAATRLLRSPSAVVAGALAGPAGRSPVVTAIGDEACGADPSSVARRVGGTDAGFAARPPRSDVGGAETGRALAAGGFAAPSGLGAARAAACGAPSVPRGFGAPSDGFGAAPRGFGASTDDGGFGAAPSAPRGLAALTAGLGAACGAPGAPRGLGTPTGAGFALTAAGGAGAVPGLEPASAPTGRGPVAQNSEAGFAAGPGEAWSPSTTSERLIDVVDVDSTALAEPACDASAPSGVTRMS